jgi:two-component system OmpR family response regulator
VLRRRGTSVPADGSAITRFAGWTLDAQYYTVRDAAGAEVELTSGEFKLLHALAVRAGRSSAARNCSPRSMVMKARLSIAR